MTSLHHILIGNFYTPGWKYFEKKKTKTNICTSNTPLLTNVYVFSEDEDFTKGISTFLSDATRRQKQREACDTIVPPSLIGIENRLLACATFEKKYV